jgi:hypothetical protein
MNQELAVQAKKETQFSGSAIPRKCDKCLQKERPLQRSAVPSARDSVPSVVNGVLRSPGMQLDEVTRAFMESRFGHDFSNVRVHTDARSAESALDINALAYTLGRDVVFGDGRYAPHTHKGRLLLAHELTHIVHQDRAGDQRAGMISQPSDVFEKDARRIASKVADGQQVQVSASGGPPAIQRDEGEKKKLPAPEEIAQKNLKAGPAGDKAFKKSAEQSLEFERKGTKISRIEVPTKNNDAGVKMVTSSEFKSKFAASPGAKAESNLPQAFLSETHSIATPDVAPEDAATLTTNVRVAFSSGKDGGSLWITSAVLPWELNTTAYLDVSVIDSAMLKAYSAHEKGHRVMQHHIRNGLAKMMQVEFERVLPSASKPLKKSGKNWGQQGVDTIVKQISNIIERYEKWFDQLNDKADSDWDKQEAKTLSDIAAAKRKGEHRPVSPPVKTPEK